MNDNTFDLICKRLSNCKCNCRCNNDQITWVEAALKAEINGNRNKFLKIKAEAMEDNPQNATNDVFVIAALILNVVAYLSAFYSRDEFGTIFGVIMVVIYLVVFLLLINKVYKHSNKWKKYIIVVLEEIEKDPEYFKTKEK